MWNVCNVCNVCMYVCMCVCMCMCMCMCMCICICICICICKCICICICMYVCMYVDICIYVYMYICINIQIKFNIPWIFIIFHPFFAPDLKATVSFPHWRCVATWPSQKRRSATSHWLARSWNNQRVTGIGQGWDGNSEAAFFGFSANFPWKHQPFVVRTSI